MTRENQDALQIAWANCILAFSNQKGNPCAEIKNFVAVLNKDEIENEPICAGNLIWLKSSWIFEFWEIFLKWSNHHQRRQLLLGAFVAVHRQFSMGEMFLIDASLILRSTGKTSCDEEYLENCYRATSALGAFCLDKKAHDLMKPFLVSADCYELIVEKLMLPFATANLQLMENLLEPTLKSLALILSKMNALKTQATPTNSTTLLLRWLENIVYGEDNYMCTISCRQIAGIVATGLQLMNPHGQKNIHDALQKALTLYDEGKTLGSLLSMRGVVANEAVSMTSEDCASLLIILQKLFQVSTLDVMGDIAIRMILLETLFLSLKRFLAPGIAARSFVPESPEYNVFKNAMDLVLKFWDDPVPSSQHKIQGIYVLIVELAVNLASSQPLIAQELLLRVSSIGSSHKIKYSLMMEIIQRFDPPEILKSSPLFLTECIESLKLNSYAPKAGDCLLQWLLAYCRMKVEIDVQFVDAICNALGSEHSSVRTNLNFYFFDPLFKRYGSRKDCALVNSLWLTCVRRIDEQLSQTKDPSKRIALLHSWIVLRTIGKGNKIWMKTEEDGAIMTICLNHVNTTLRHEAYSLLCLDAKATALSSREDLESVISFISRNLAVDSSEFRNNFLRSTKILLRRTKAGLFALKRKVTDYEKIITEQKHFFDCLIEHLVSCLSSFAPFAKVHCVLTLLSDLTEEFGDGVDVPLPEGFNWDESKSKPAFPFHIALVTPQTWSAVFQMLSDRFEVNRKQAFNLLKQWSVPEAFAQSSDFIEKWIVQGENLMRCPRPHEAEGGIFTNHLLILKDLCPKIDDDNTSTQAIFEILMKKDVRMRTELYINLKLSEIKTYLSSIETDMLQMAKDPSLYCTFALVRSLLAGSNLSPGSLSSIVSALIDNINQASCIIMKILSCQSPEGALPQEIETPYQGSFVEMDIRVDQLVEVNGESSYLAENNQRNQKSMMLLSACWRTMRELCSTLHSILELHHTMKYSLLNYEQVCWIGQQLRFYLHSIRHMGAVAAVYPVYGFLCQTLLTSNLPIYHQLISDWLIEELDLLDSDKTRFSITRRSAGIPCCIVSILAAEASVKLADTKSAEISRPLLRHTMKFLFELANTPVDLSTLQHNRTDIPQVHAFNILKAIFRDTRMGADVLGFVDHGLILAIDGFSHSCWAIRNCATMLFSTMISRIFSGQRSQIPSEFFGKAPNFRHFLLNKLQSWLDLIRKDLPIPPGLYPSLLLLTYLRPVLEGSDSLSDSHVSITPFAPILKQFLGVRDSKVRKMAAEALCSMMPANEASIVQHIRNLLMVFMSEIGTKRIESNTAHGMLFHIQILLERHYPVTIGDNYDDRSEAEIGRNPFFGKISSEVFPTMHSMLELKPFIFECVLNCACISSCDMVKALCLNIVRKIMDPHIDCVSTETLTQILGVAPRLLYFLVEKEICLINLKLGRIGIHSFGEIFDNLSEESRVVCLDYFLQTGAEMDCETHGFLLQKLAKYSLTSKVCALILQILQKSDDATFERFLLQWQAIIRTQDHQFGISERCELIKILGRLVSISPSEHSLKQVWIDWMLRYSHPQEAIEYRVACTDSVIQMLSVVFNNILEFLSVVGTVIASRLLQDEDEDIRTSLAFAVSMALREEGLPDPLAPFVLVEIIFKMASLEISRSVDAYSFMRDLIVELDMFEEHEDVKNSIIFSKEPDNIIKEPLLDAKIAFKYLKTYFEDHGLVKHDLCYQDKHKYVGQADKQNLKTQMLHDLFSLI